MSDQRDGARREIRARQRVHAQANSLRSAYFFDQETFGADALVVGTPGGAGGGGRSGAAAGWDELLARTRLPKDARGDWRHIQADEAIDEPILVPPTRTPNRRGLASAREQHKAGHIGRRPFGRITIANSDAPRRLTLMRRSIRRIARSRRCSTGTT